MEFYRDFFETDIMNHVEFLKTLTDLNKEDHLLLIPILEHLSSNTPPSDVTPFYRNHRSQPKNIMNILRSYTLLKDLEGHDFNIFEYSFLTGYEHLHEVSVKLLAVFTLFVQFMILIILIFFNSESKLTKDPIIYLIDYATTQFFFSMSMKQVSGCRTFNGCYFLTGDSALSKRVFLYFNWISNVFLPIVVLFFNAYFIALSPDPNTAVLNSMALYFILDMDSMILPEWSDERVDDEKAINVHDYIMVPPNYNLTLTKDHIEEGVTFNEDNKYYISIRDREIYVYVRQDSTKYLTKKYTVGGDSAQEFLYLIRQFKCLQNYYDIHD
jgi:hypothetical protein